MSFDELFFCFVSFQLSGLCSLKDTPMESLHGFGRPSDTRIEPQLPTAFVGKENHQLDKELKERHEDACHACAVSSTSWQAWIIEGLQDLTRLYL